SPNGEEGYSPAHAKPRRSVCAPGLMAFSLYRRPSLERRSIMWFSSWLGKRQRAAASGRRHSSPRKRSSYRPRMEALEGRLVPSGGYIFKTIDDPNAALPAGTLPYGINGRGQIVGEYTDASGNFHGFLRKGGEYTTLDDPNALLALRNPAVGINDRGQIVGWYVDANFVVIHGFLLSGGQYTALDDPMA